MEIVLLIFAIAAILWSVTLLKYHDLPLGCAIFLVVSSVFSSDFFALDAGGLTWTLDRFWLLFLVAQITYNLKEGLIRWREPQTLDLLLIAFAIWLIARTLPFPLGQSIPEQPATLMHLLNGYLIPFFLYALSKACSNHTGFFVSSSRRLAFVRRVSVNNSSVRILGNVVTCISKVYW